MVNGPFVVNEYSPSQSFYAVEIRTKVPGSEFDDWLRVLAGLEKEQANSWCEQLNKAVLDWDRLDALCGVLAQTTDASTGSRAVAQVAVNALRYFEREDLIAEYELERKLE